MLWPQTDATHYHAQLRFPEKGLAIKELVVCYVVWLRSMINGMGLQTSARCLVWMLVVVRMAIKLKYRNTPEIHTDTYHNIFLYSSLSRFYLYKPHQSNIVNKWDNEFGQAEFFSLLISLSLIRSKGDDIYSYHSFKHHAKKQCMKKKYKKFRIDLCM